MKKCASIIGARPQFVKAAPMSKELSLCDDIEEILIHTGQHFDKNMSDVFFDELNIPEPSYNLDIHGGGHGQMTGRMLEKIEHIFLEEKPDFVIVYGDTNSTLAGALAAAKLSIPVVHIEAGLRSFNKSMPEEINRILTDHTSDVLICPTSLAIENLKKEGITKNTFITGDLMYDTVKLVGSYLDNPPKQVAGKDYLLLSLHRPGNVDCPDRLKKIIKFIEDFARGKSLEILFPMHPRAKAKFEEFGLKVSGANTISPLGYIDMQSALKHAKYMLTDSGGIQKEAYFHKVPCITLRDETEWVETIDNGWNRLWTCADYKERKEINDYGIGHSAKDIVDIIRSTFL